MEKAKIDMTRGEDLQIVCDNGGNLILRIAQPDRSDGRDYWWHYYDDADQIANDILTYLQGSDPSDWDGDEESEMDEYDNETERNGGYRWHNSLTELLEAKTTQYMGYAEHELRNALADRRLGSRPETY